MRYAVIFLWASAQFAEQIQTAILRSVLLNWTLIPVGGIMRNSEATGATNVEDVPIQLGLRIQAVGRVNHQVVLFLNINRRFPVEYRKCSSIKNLMKGFTMSGSISSRKVSLCHMSISVLNNALIPTATRFGRSRLAWNIKSKRSFQSFLTDNCWINCWIIVNNCE